jgi:hypothetical protein
MSQIYNRSPHPVEIKRISVRVWSLRDEIEAALERRIKECEALGVPLDVEDIKKFYNLKPGPLRTQPQLQMVSAPASEDDKEIQALLASTSGETPATSETSAPSPESDGDMAAMAAAMGEKTEEKSTAPSPTNEAPVASQVDQVMATQEAQAQTQSTPSKEDLEAQKVLKVFSRQPPNSDKISYGFTMLSDVNMDWVLCFSREKFIHGQTVVIEFLIPKSFKMTCEVMMCTHYSSTSRIISDTKPNFRLQLLFQFALDGERTVLREFLESIEPRLPQKPDKKSKEAQA